MQSKIEIEVTPISGKFIILASIGNDPEDAVKKWNTTENVLSIVPAEANIINRGVIFVEVNLDLENLSQQEERNEYSFRIVYYTKESF